MDGAFFEGFVEIKDKQKEHVAVAARISQKREAQSSSYLTIHTSPGGKIHVPPNKENVSVFIAIVFKVSVSAL